MIHKVLPFLRGVEALMKLLFWAVTTYFSLKVWIYKSKLREVRQFKRALSVSGVPKELRSRLISEYRQGLSNIYSGFSIRYLARWLRVRKVSA